MDPFDFLRNCQLLTKNSAPLSWYWVRNRPTQGAPPEIRTGTAVRLTVPLTETLAMLAFFPATGGRDHSLVLVPHSLRQARGGGRSEQLRL